MKNIDKKIENCIEKVFSDLNNAELSKNDVKKIVEKEANIKIANEYKKVFDEKYKLYHSAELNYGKSKRAIEKTTPIFKKLLKEKVNGKTLKVENNIVLLNKRNAEIIDGILKADEDYLDFAHKMYQGIVRNEKNGLEKFKKNKEKKLTYVLREIDRDNSTNVWRYDEKGREAFRAIVNYIVDEKRGFFTDLEKGEKKLPDKLLGEAKKSKDCVLSALRLCVWLCDN